MLLLQACLKWVRVLGGGLQSVPLFGFLPQRYNRGLRLAAGQLQDGQDLLAVQGVITSRVSACGQCRSREYR